ncbi:uncharacterized protein BDR25DRAFT_27092 [Lindgomyces ingoldianus]|uniref:Uncharacterized protein n=1 Tax=Lindgomyces ingoldianus TaxID=673940 RepID=A0ACB6QZ80_9PLEO|nr:uncharacterized protein BDR25DRAFT_27092 [Lindgomyces ingoldianus]KAF2471412.1 hypothetical protein BDR25DRAFT_27092 [Lindgomyces ingoldianus]
MLESLQKRCRDHLINQAALARCCVRVDKIRVRMEPFFEIIGIFAQSHADIACIVWGSLRLLFQLGENYVTFLEKICTMLDDMTDVLPAYEEYVGQIQSKYSKEGVDFAPRLLKALAFVYSDILDFCLGAVRILSPAKGTRSKAKLVWGLCWRPFDVRFRAILERFNKHTQALDREMGSTSFNVMRQHCERIEYDMRKAREERAWQDERQMKRERVHDLREWIGAGDWESFYEELADRRVTGSCGWLRYDPIYVSWKKAMYPKNASQLHSGINQDILLVDAKPGYGKTFLCASLIEEYRRKRDLSINSTEPTAAFFLFNRLEQDAKKLQPDTAFRAILTQLLHAHELEDEVIDALSLIKHHNGRGQLEASFDEVLLLLHWLLDRYPNTILLFDGVDECWDEPAFFRSLRKIIGADSQPTTTSSTPPRNARPGVILFARPTLSLPAWVAKRHCSIHLNSAQNFVDIQSYLHEKIAELGEYGLLGDAHEISAILENACQFANGMFLWARLLIEYLSADGLSVNDRREALNNLVRFEGLDQLYSLILQNLAKKLPPKSRVNLKAAFQWIGGALRPLHVDELPHAIVSTAEGTWNERDVIPNLKQSLTRMSGALLELAPDLTVRFTHTSVLEFLCGDHLDQDARGEERQFRMCAPSVQQLVALSCLRYISRTVPPMPLSGSSQITPERDVQSKRFPLADYSLKHWVKHVDLAISRPPPNKFAFLSFVEGLLQAMQGFLNSKKQVMVWIELSWLFGYPAALGNIPQLFAKALTVRHGMVEGYEKLPRQLECLSEDLKILEIRWGTVLSQTPNEIWEPSIPAFTQSDYYMITKEVSLTRMETVVNHAEKSVMIQSQVSASGKEISVVRLSIPKNLLENSVAMHPDEWMQRHTSGWKAIFEVWNLSTKLLEFRFFVPIPAAHARQILSQQANFCNDILYKLSKPLALDRLDFEFPVSISLDLRVALILGCYIKIELRYEDTSASHPHRYTMYYIELNPWGDLTQPDPRVTSPLIPASFAACLSPSGQEMLVVRPSNGNGNAGALTMGLRYWDLLLYYKLECHGTQHLSKSASKLRVDRFDLYVDYQQTQDLGQHFLFHPFLPILVFCLGKKTIGWSYSEPGARVVEICAHPLRKLSISGCGQYLQGFTVSRHGDKMVVLDISSILCRVLNLVPIRMLEQSIVDLSLAGRNDNRLTRIPNSTISTAITLQDLVRNRAAPATMTTNTVQFITNENGVTEMSMLRQFEQEGAVVLHTLSEDGVATSKTITRLPEDLVSRSEPVLVKAKEGEEKNSETVMLVLNQKPKPTYSFREEEGGEVLPIVLERTTASIPVTAVNLGRTLN